MIALPLDLTSSPQTGCGRLDRKTAARFPDCDAPDAVSSMPLSAAVLLQHKKAVTRAEFRFWSRVSGGSLVESARHT